MARRNPMNERYGKTTAPAGKTRKSAAAAKPKRPDATGSSKSSKGSSATKKAAGKPAREQIALHPPTPQYRFWRRVWLGLMVTAVALVGASFYLMQNNQRSANYVLVATYVVLGIGVFLDFFKLRRLRLEWHASGGKLESPAEKSPAEKSPAEKSGDAAAPDAESSSASDKS